MSALRSKRPKESNKSILLALVKKRGERFSTALLDHIEDVVLGKLMEDTVNSPQVSKESVMKILRSERTPKKIKEVDDPEMLKALEASKNAKEVSREQIFKTLRSKRGN